MRPNLQIRLSAATVSQFWRLWIGFTFSDAASGAFGVASIPGAALAVGGMRYLGHKMSETPQISEVFLYALAGAGAGWGISLLANFLYFAPRKAYKVMNPFFLSVSDSITTNFIRNETIKSHDATIIVKNRSCRAILDCYIYIYDISETNKTLFPRFVDKFDLPAEETKYVTFASWCSRESPYTDDAEIGISGPVAACYGGNILRIPLKTYTVKIRARVPDSRSSGLDCSLWVDPIGRRLRVE
jgi:hypothetical protein